MSTLRESDEYSVVDIFVDKEGQWHRRGKPTTPQRALFDIDVVFPLIYSLDSDGGTVQRDLDQLGKAYVGSTPFEARLCSTRRLARKAMEQTGIKMPYSVMVRRDDFAIDTARELFRTFPQPSIIKSTKRDIVFEKVARTFFDFNDALEELFSLSETAFIEEYIPGKSATCGVIDDYRNKESYLLLPVESTEEGDSISCPGCFSDSEKKAIMELAERAHNKLRLRDFSQSKMIISPRGVYYLGSETQFDISESSPFVKSLEALGSSQKEFLEHCVRRALSRV